MTAETVHVGGLALMLREVLPGDQAAVLALHTLVFGPEVDAKWFAWKYGSAQEQGQGQAVGVWHGSELIAHCGGVPRTVWRDGCAVQGLQIGDVMVHPAWRGILTRHGPFFYVSKNFYDSRLGAIASHPFQLGFGFPNVRHLRLAVLLALLHDDGVMESLHWSAAQATLADLPWAWRWQEILPTVEHFDRDVNAAWQAMRSKASDQALGQRDATYLRWRYADRPNTVGTPPDTPARYRFFKLQRPWSSQPVGVAVLDLRSSSAHWLDWVGPLDLMPLAVHACRLEAARASAFELTAWASTAVAQQLADTGITQREVCAGLGIPTSSDLKPQDVPGMRWWLMGGDTDFL